MNWRVWWTFESHQQIEKNEDGDPVDLPSVVVGASSREDALSRAWQVLGRNPIMNMVDARKTS